MSMLNRSDIPVEETWNLEDLFATEQAYTAAIEEVRQLVEETAAKLAGTITDVQGAINAIEATEKIQEKMVVIGTYASLSHSVDQTNTDNQMRAASFGSFAAKLATTLSFVKSDLLALDEAVLKEAQTVKPEYANFIDKLLVQKPHQLHPEAEKALAAFGATFNAPYELYNTTKLVDMQFPDFEVGGESFPLSYNLFEGDWELETDTDKRRAAFEAFSKKLRDYQHTTAKTYNTHLAIEKRKQTFGATTTFLILY